MSVAKKLAKHAVDEKTLRKLIPIGTFALDRVRELADKAAVEHLPAGRTLFKLGDNDLKTYYVIAGEVEVQLPGGQNIAVKADTPAALHPISDTRPRKATVVTKTNTTFLSVDSGLLDILANCDTRHNYEVNEIHADDESDWMTRFLQSLSAMNIPIKNIEHLMQRMEELPVRAGDAVIRQTDSNTEFYFVVKEGRCAVTRQTGSAKTPIRIAELNEGVGFGEEALLSNQPRGATVTMITDGLLMRLSKEDFKTLIAAPALHYATFAQAQHMARAGAVWIDTRSEGEFRSDGIIGSIHIPLSALRQKTKDLNIYGKYIAYCDNGNRAAAAAFVLRQLGFDVFALTNGIADVPADIRKNQGAPAPSNTGAQPSVVDLDAARSTATAAGAVGSEQKSAKLKANNNYAETDGDTNRSAEIAETARRLAEAQRALEQSYVELDALRTQLAEARANEKTSLQRAQKVSDVARELQAVKSDYTALQERLTKLDKERAHAEQEKTRLRSELDTARSAAQNELRRMSQIAVEKTEAEIARHVEAAQKEKALANEYALNLTAAEATVEAARKELEILRREIAATKNVATSEIEQLRAENVAKVAEIQRMKNQLEREAERKRAAEAEATRLKAEAESARQRADELTRRAQDTESQQAAMLAEVQRKIEAADAMKREAENQAKELRNTAEQSRRRAEEEARRVAEAEAARAKALEESERRARLTEEIRRKADEEIARLKADAEAARISAEEARKKSQAADAARRQVESEIKRQEQSIAAQNAATKSSPSENSGAEGDLDDLERELAQLQSRLESKKRAAISRKQEINEESDRKAEQESEIVQNVYDIHQKTQKLPAFKANQGPNTNVGKVQKSGWISDAILWETTIGLREDSEAEKMLVNEPAPPAKDTKPEGRRTQTQDRALSSGELRAQEAKKSVFTARDSREYTPPAQQRRVDIPTRTKSPVGMIAAFLIGAAAVGGGVYVAMDKSGESKQKIVNIIEKAAPGRSAQTSTTAPTAQSDDSTAAAPAISNRNTPAALKESQKTFVDPNPASGTVQRKDTAPAVKTESLKSASPALDERATSRTATPASKSEAGANTPVTKGTPEASSAVRDTAATSISNSAKNEPVAAQPATIDEQTPTSSAPATPENGNADTIRDGLTPAGEATRPAVPTFSDVPPVN